MQQATPSSKVDPPPVKNYDYGSSTTVSEPPEKDIESASSKGKKGKKEKKGNRKESEEAKHDHRDHGIIETVDNEPRVVLVKTYPLLIVVVVIMIISVIGFVLWSYHQNKFGQPPTEFSKSAYESTILALISLFVSCISTIIVVRCKIRHLAIGYLVMFSFNLTFYFCLKGASRAYVSIQYDDIVTIEDYIFTKNNNNRSDGELPHFFHRLQINFQCCGTNTIDRMKDWPERLKTKHMPQSCCKKFSPSCGKLLARTYNYYGSLNEPMRIPSGYFVAMTENEMGALIKSGNPVKIVGAPGKHHGSDIVLAVVMEFYFKKLKEGYPPGTPLESIRRLPNDIVEPIDISNNSSPTSIGCRDDLSLEKVTSVGWEIQQLLDTKTSEIHQQSSHHDKIAWQIPTCKEIVGEPPFHLASNFKREIVNPRMDVKHMWYISQGIAENYILKDLIWDKYCERHDKSDEIPDLPLVSLIAGKKRTRANAVVGNFFISFVNQLMIACLAISAVVAILLFFVFLIFWKYYSRIRLEEYANLPFPPEFEVLQVRQSDLYRKHDKDEYDKVKSRQLREKDEAEAARKKGSQDHHHKTGQELDEVFVGQSVSPMKASTTASSVNPTAAKPAPTNESPNGNNAASKFPPTTTETESPNANDSALKVSPTPIPTSVTVTVDNSGSKVSPTPTSGTVNVNNLSSKVSPSPTSGTVNENNSAPKVSPTPTGGTVNVNNSGSKASNPPKHHQKKH